ncbi:efflux RND transporter periplasmic adaptor subunit, partial [Acinetobacter baumannii]
GMSVTVEVEAFPQRRFAGRVVAVNPAIDPASRSAVVEAEIENGDNALRAGMFATVRILRGQSQRVVLVPRAAVLRDQSTQSYRVFVIQGDVARL